MNSLVARLIEGLNDTVRAILDLARGTFSRITAGFPKVVTKRRLGVTVGLGSSVSYFANVMLHANLLTQLLISGLSSFLLAVAVTLVEREHQKLSLLYDDPREFDS